MSIGKEKSTIEHLMPPIILLKLPSEENFKSTNNLDTFLGGVFN